MVAQAIKDHLIVLCGSALRSGAGLWLARRYFYGRCSVIYYHAVWRASDPRIQLFGGRELGAFASDLRKLAKCFDFVPLSQLLENSHAGSRPSLAITFDDGFDLTSGGATQVMDEMGVRATMFVNTASVNYQALMWQHRIVAIMSMRGPRALVDGINRIQKDLGLRDGVDPLPKKIIAATRGWPMRRKDDLLDQVWSECRMPCQDEILRENRPYFDWEALQDWMRRGHEVGFHTHSHPFCSALRREDLETEFVQPALELRDRLGVQSVPFAYPFGDRLRSDMEAKLVSKGIFSCLLGTSDVFSKADIDPNMIDRVDAEPDVDSRVYGRPIISDLRRRLVGQGTNR